MKTQHTPGPWTIHGSRQLCCIGPEVSIDGEFAYIWPVVCRIETDKLAVYCHTGKHNGSRQRLDRDELESVQANARLIAAAPDLLAALTAQADYLASLSAQFSGYNYAEFRLELQSREHDARSAIAKATNSQ